MNCSDLFAMSVYPHMSHDEFAFPKEHLPSF